MMEEEEEEEVEDLASGGPARLAPPRPTILPLHLDPISKSLTYRRQ